MAIIDVNLEAIQPGLSEPLPPGDYECRVADSLLIRSKSGRPLLKFIYDVLGGPHGGRRLLDAMLLDHEAGLCRLKTLALRAGHPNPNFLHDSDELHGLRFVAKVLLETDETGALPPRNLVKAYRPAGAAAQGR